MLPSAEGSGHPARAYFQSCPACQVGSGPSPGSAVLVPSGIGGALLPALALAATCLLACLQDMSWMLIQHRRGGVQYADSRALKGQTVPPQPLAASGGWRRGGSHFPGSWRVCVLPLVGASTPPVTQRTQWELARRDLGSVGP